MNMDRAPELSVIVPIYNAEQYLERCLISITEQTFENLEDHIGK